MEPHEFVAKAKSKFAVTVAPEATPPSPSDFPRVRVRETVLVYFESEDRKNEAVVLLDRATGDAVLGWSRIHGDRQGRIA
jgi:hypothetical protein